MRILPRLLPLLSIVLLFPVLCESATRPNIIHIMVDDMSADAMGFRGRFDFLKTPHLDRLAENGIVFDNFFVTDSICSPSRASILTGRYAHGTGVPDNASRRDPDPSLPTYPALLQKAGYITAHIGKWHQGRGDQPRPGFTHWFAFEGQGDYFDPVINNDGKVSQHKGYVTDLLTDEAIDFIQKNKSHPFAMNLWHKAAHGPFRPAPRHAEDMTDVHYPKPPSWDHDLNDKPGWMRRSRLFGGVHYKTWVQSEGKPIPATAPARPFTYENTEKYRNHLSTLHAVDDSVGRIMDTLEETGLLDSTIVVFTADNGYFLGEFARGDKRLAYEPSIKVPMILHYPKLARSGSTLAAFGTNLDFAPTFLELAEVKTPATMQGTSLLPVLEGQVEQVRDAVFYEYFQESYAPGIPTMLGLRTARWKYITTPYEDAHLGADELYDLENDPHEMNSLAADPEYAETLGLMRQKLLAEMKRFGYERPAYIYTPPEVASALPDSERQ